MTTIQKSRCQDKLCRCHRSQEATGHIAGQGRGTSGFQEITMQVGRDRGIANRRTDSTPRRCSRPDSLILPSCRREGTIPMRRVAWAAAEILRRTIYSRQRSSAVIASKEEGGYSKGGRGDAEVSEVLPSLIWEKKWHERKQQWHGRQYLIINHP